MKRKFRRLHTEIETKNEENKTKNIYLKKKEEEMITFVMWREGEHRECEAYREKGLFNK